VQTLTQLKQQFLSLGKEIALLEKMKGLEEVRPRFSKTRTRQKTSGRILSRIPRKEERVIDGLGLMQRKRVSTRFAKAIGVMLELRTQPGIVDPTKVKSFYVINFKKSQGVWVGRHVDSVGQILGPAFRTAKDANNAIEAVGIERVWDAFETLLFIDS
jgi:hypothetical protein